MMTARELIGQYNIIILEARSRAGGRINTISSRTSQKIEGGAEFIHGQLPVTLQLLKEARIDHVPVEGKMYRKDKGEWNEQTEMIEGWDLLLKKMKALKADMTMYDFLQQYFSGSEYDDLRRYATAYTEGFDIADVRKVSVMALYKEWSEVEEDNLHIPAGYKALIDFLCNDIEKKGGRILTNQTVRQIDWERNEVTVYTSSEKYQGEKAIVTIPVSVLRKTAGSTSINFTPPLHDYIKAAEDIGMGSVVKVVFHFKERFWKENAAFIFSDEQFPTWWTQLPDTVPILTGWAGGTRAEQFSELTDEMIFEKAMFSLANIFDRSIDELKANIESSHVFNWQKEEASLGAYTYAMPASDLAKKILNLPVADTIYFAGEALYDGTSPGTVEAALVSGKNVATKVNSKF